MADPQKLKALLDSLPTSQRVRASVWDAFNEPDEARVRARLDSLPLDTATKAEIWDAAYAPATVSADDVPTWATFNEQPVALEPPPPSATQMFGGLARGVGKSFGRAAVEAGDLVHQVPGVSRGVNALYGALGVPNMDSAQMMQDALQQPELTPQTGAEEVGKFAGDVGQFFLPGGTAKSLVLNPRSPAALVRGMFNEGVRGGLFSNLQGADATGTEVGAATGAMGPVLGRALEKAPQFLKRKALERTQQFLGGTKEKYKAMGAKVAPGIWSRGVSGWLGASREAMMATALARAQSAGRVLDTMLQGSGHRKVNTQVVYDRLEHLKNAYRTRRIVTPAELVADPELAKRATQLPTGEFELEVVFDERPIKQLTRLQKILTELGPEPEVEKVVALRRAWDDVVEQAGGYAHRAKGAIGMPLKESTEAWAKREAANKIRGELAKAVPNLDKINKEYSFWINVADTLKQTQQRTTPQAKNLGKTIMAAGGFGAGIASGGDVADKAEKAALYGAVGSALSQAFTSPRWRLVSAKLRLALASAIVSGNPDRIATATGRVLNATMQPLTPGTTVKR